VLAAAVIVPLIGKTYPGTAIATPPPGPPQVGDCVLDPVEPTWQTMAKAGWTKHYAYPRLTTGTCHGDHYGEIVALIADPAQPEVTETAVNDPNLDHCWKAADEFSGVPFDVTATTLLAPLLHVSSAATAPSVRQEAAGQHWLACIAYLEPHDFVGQTLDTDVGRFEQYRTSLRDALRTGTEKNRTATCVIGALDQQNAVQDCSRPHTGEIFGIGSVATAPQRRALLVGECQKLVAQRTRIPDLAAAGLTVVLIGTDENGVSADVPVYPAGSALTCGVTSVHDRLLAGSLVLLGDRPVPWA
jgi:hypothetical protein